MTKRAEGVVSCFIPAFDVCFSVRGDVSVEACRAKGRAIMKMWINHFFNHAGMKSFALEMHKRGFKAPNDAFTVKQFIRNQIPASTRFGKDVSGGFEGERVTQEDEAVIAA